MYLKTFWDHIVLLTRVKIYRVSQFFKSHSRVQLVVQIQNNEIWICMAWGNFKRDNFQGFACS